MKETTAPRDAPEACLDIMNFAKSWDDWRGSLRETVETARELDPSDRNIIGTVQDIIDFLAARVCSGSPEEKMVAELWDLATAEEREMLARVFLRMIDTAPTSAP
ncbi:MAG: DUF3243 family protein [Methanomassiliicoccus sp.]|nr:DUF3243 family protein [Methanomassiliicoccus sp.]